jgi:hypothetical protein
MKLSVQGKFTVLTLLIFTFFISSVMDSEARRRRYNPDKTRKQAIEIIRSSSEEICNLAGLKPLPKDSIDPKLLKKLEDDSEILTEEIGDKGEDLDELEAEGDVEISMDEFNTLWLSFLEEDEEESYTDYGVKKSDIMDAIMDWLGTPYRFGGTTRRAIDCSAFTQKIFLQTGDVMIPRTAREQVKYGQKIDRKDLRFGDMIFFHTYSRRFASHVGIYLGDNLFAHASSRYGVTIASLDSKYYQKRFIGGRRLTGKDMVRFGVFEKENQ